MILFLVFNLLVAEVRRQTSNGPHGLGRVEGTRQSVLGRFVLEVESDGLVRPPVRLVSLILPGILDGDPALVVAGFGAVVRDAAGVHPKDGYVVSLKTEFDFNRLILGLVVQRRLPHPRASIDVANGQR